MAKLATLGLTDEQAEVVAGMLCEVEEATATQAEAVVERSRAKARDRMAKWRETHKNDVTERHVASHPVTKTLTGASAPVEDKTLTTDKISKKDKKVERASRLPENWTLPVEWRTDALAEKLPEHLIDLEASKMRDWSQSAPKGAKVNWRPAWRNWCREAAARAGQHPRAGPVPRPNPALAAADALMEKFDAVSPSQTEANPPYPRLVALSSG